MNADLKSNDKGTIKKRERMVFFVYGLQRTDSLVLIAFRRQLRLSSLSEISSKLQPL